MNGRTILGLVLLLVGVGVAIFGGYNLATAGVAESAPSPRAPSSTAPPAEAPESSAAPSVVSMATPAAASAPAPTAPPSPTVGSDPDAAVRAFFAGLVTAIRSGGIESMAARLNGAVIDRYGVAACEAQLAANEADPTYAVEILAIGDLAPWDYVTDDRTTTIEEAWTVDAMVTAAGASESRQLHVAPMDGGVSWFTDCGTPLPNAPGVELKPR